jgi:hypothetical protein
MTTISCPTPIQRYGFGKVLPDVVWLWDDGKKQSTQVVKDTYVFKCSSSIEDKHTTYLQRLNRKNKFSFTCMPMKIKVAELKVLLPLFYSPDDARVVMEDFMESNEDVMRCGCGKCVYLSNPYKR